MGKSQNNLLPIHPFRCRFITIACMENDFLQDLGGKIKIVEKVETDDNGDYIGEFARIRILVNITQPLEKFFFLKQEGEIDIPMPVVYERLSDFCFCCGVIGHQYKECGKFQGQQREELPYGNWMKAITLWGHTKKNRNKERWNYKGGKLEEKSASLKNHSFSQQQQQNQDNRTRANGSEPIEKETGQTKQHAKMGEVEGVGEQHLMR